EVFYALPQTLLRPLVPEVAALEIGVIGLDVIRVAPRQLVSLFRGQPEQQLLGYFPGDFYFDSKNVRRLAAVALAPQAGPVRRVYQLCPDDEIVARLKHPPGEYRAHPEMSPDIAGVNLPALVAGHRTPGHDPQLRQARERVDDAFGDPVAEVFHGRVGGGAGQRQNGERIDYLRLPAGRDRSGRGRNCLRLDPDHPAARRASRLFRKFQLTPEAPQIREQFSGRLLALLTALAQRLVDNPFQRLRHFGREVRQRRRFPAEDCRDHIRPRRRGERGDACDQLIEHYAQAEDVGPRVHLLSARLFRRHIAGRPHHHSGLG